MCGSSRGEYESSKLGKTAAMSDKIAREELEELEGEVLPERAAMSIVDPGATLLGFHGPSPPVVPADVEDIEPED
jgi:hypothetical protein